jgi:rod shape-determining protein MreC
MAPPAHRRSGVNKKADLGVFAGYVVAALGALFGAALLAISLLRPETFNGLRSSASDAARRSEKAARPAVRTSQSFSTRSRLLSRRQPQRRAREGGADRPRPAGRGRRASSRRTRGSRRCSGCSEGPKPVAVARLIGSTSSSARRFGYISAGRDDGVRRACR